jgi:hypothetical protein
VTFPFGETVTVHRRAPRDDFGRPGAVTSHQIEGVALAPRRSEEGNTPTRNTVTAGLVAFMPYDADIRATDTVERFDGTKWAVVGTPMRWRSPLTGWMPGTEVELERVTG